MSSIPWPFPKLVWRPHYRQPQRVASVAGPQAPGHGSRDHCLRPGRVYILPTGVGLIFGLMAFAMLLGSMNYNNNLSFVLTFMLIGIGFVSMHQCQRNLVGLELSFAGADPCSPDSRSISHCHHQSVRKRPLWHSHLHDTTESDVQDLQPGESKIFVLPLQPNNAAGQLERFGVRTLFPVRAFPLLGVAAHGLQRPGLSAPGRRRTRTTANADGARPSAARRAR